MPLPLVIGAGPAALAIAAKKKENKRKQALANKYSQKYPLSEDINTNAASISAAQFELKSISSQPANTSAAKRVKKRESELLSKWIGVMKNHAKDLQAGLAPATSTGAPAPMQADATQQAAPTPVLDGGGPGPVGGTPVSLGPSAGGEDQGGEGQAGAEGKKKTNWILIGGVALGVVLLFNFMKKK